VGARFLGGGHFKAILRAPFHLLPRGCRADTRFVRPFVTVVICGLVALPAGASASPVLRTLVRDASRLSGFAVKRPVRTTAVSAPLFSRAWTRDYPAPLRRADATAYRQLGLAEHSVDLEKPRAWYDVAAKRLFLQRSPAATRRAVLHEVVRALIDQNYGLARLAGLRTRDRDRWLAANAIVDGTASLASGARAGVARGTPLDRFTALEATAGLGAGRALAAQLRYLGGRSAVASALRTFPQTTEQLLHVDKFLERERALPIRLPAEAGGVRLEFSETFGELDVRSLLQAFRIPGAAATAAGWGGGRMAAYGGLTVLVLRWDTPADATEWQAAMPYYVAAAFPDASARTCAPLDACWGDVAAGTFGTRTVLASGPGSAVVAAALLAGS
jgi:hypothetical protein